MPENTGEPVAVQGAVQAGIPIVIAALVAFGVWDPSVEQIASVSAVYGVIVGIWTGITRKKVTPV